MSPVTYSITLSRTPSAAASVRFRSASHGGARAARAVVPLMYRAFSLVSRRPLSALVPTRARSSEGWPTFGADPSSFRAGAQATV
jgi:hypothetical protein